MKKYLQYSTPKFYYYYKLFKDHPFRLSSIEGTLHLAEDAMRLRVCPVAQLTGLSQDRGMTILLAGTSCNQTFQVNTSFRVAGRWLQGKKLSGNIFWDLQGFAAFVFAKKK